MILPECSKNGCVWCIFLLFFAFPLRKKKRKKKGNKRKQIVPECCKNQCFWCIILSFLPSYYLALVRPKKEQINEIKEIVTDALLPAIKVTLLSQQQGQTTPIGQKILKTPGGESPAAPQGGDHLGLSWAPRLPPVPVAFWFPGFIASLGPWKPMQIDEPLWKSLKIAEKAKKAKETLRNSMNIHDRI